MQTNLNHARHAQELLYQSMAELEIGLAIIAEPYNIPENDARWMGSTDGSVACMWRFTGEIIPCSLVERGECYVAVKWDDIVVVGVYLSPRWNRQSFEEALARIERCVRANMPAPTIVAGDFNAKSALWGSTSRNVRGDILVSWAELLGLVCMNTGSESTCQRAQGESIVDTTWASPSAARRLDKWKVWSEMETLSDHVYITMEIKVRMRLPVDENEERARRLVRPKRWTLSKLDEDKLIAALLVIAWPDVAVGEERSLEEEVARLREDLHNACDVAMPRSAPRPQTAAYWWSETIAEARRTTIARRRLWKESRGMENEVILREEYRQARYELCAAINKAKSGAWDELIRSLDRDPWGRPYKIVRNKLKKWAPPKTETMEPEFLNEVIGTLFPEREEEEAHIVTDGLGRGLVGRGDRDNGGGEKDAF